MCVGRQCTYALLTDEEWMLCGGTGERGCSEWMGLWGDSFIYICFGVGFCCWCWWCGWLGDDGMGGWWGGGLVGGVLGYGLGYMIPWLGYSI